MKIDTLGNILGRLFWALIGSIITLGLIGQLEGRSYAWEMLAILLAMTSVGFVVLFDRNPSGKHAVDEDIWYG